MRSLTRRACFIGWSVSFPLALACFAILAQGLMRDVYTGDPVVAFDPTKRSNWLSVPFRVWGKGAHALHISSVNHDPAVVGRRFEGELQVRVTDPARRPVLEKSYAPGAAGYRLPDNYGDAVFERLTLDGWPLHPWHLEMRVTKADPQFVTGRTELRLRKQRYEPGMGGLINYAMIVPGGILLLIALVLSLPLARAGTRWPLIATLAATVGILLVLT